MMLDKMNVAVEHDTKDDKTPEWAKWKGPGPILKKWYATDSKTGNLTMVYRSYEDYVMD